ncbi:hypothetical protein NIIDMKKI_40770 [Mycobacterium kansasii]|uniref:Beta-ketoacyl synthase-like N-terminal domain-containing protein n=1 Tax=Mycobacterium kansasii TaxID=1768 RepID=A0A7G1ICW3_MYCKA|nr:hypothetical protein NIIDMKKI_40770 [Mycobacterium kansasii]
MLRGDDTVTEVPADRWDADEYYDPEPGVPGRTVCKWGSFLDNVGDFDPEFFGITEKRQRRSTRNTACFWKPHGRPWNTPV